MARNANRAGMKTATAGTGTVTLGAALANTDAINQCSFQTFANAGINDGEVVSYLILDGNGAWEYGTGTYTAAGTTLSRTLGQSSTGALLNLSGAAQVFVSPRKQDIGSTRRTITGADTIVHSDRANVVEITSGTFTLAFSAAASIGADFFTYIYNSGTGDVTLDPNSTEQIDGLTSWVLYPGGAILCVCTGTAWESVLLAPMRKQFDSSGTLTKPGVGVHARVQGWGAGGSGGRGVSAGPGSGGAGGGGGAYKEVILALSAFGTTETVTIGAGGTSQTVDNTSGTAGGNTTLGSLFTVYGGGGGSHGVGGGSGSGGGGGGGAGAGTNSTSASGVAGGEPISTYDDGVTSGGFAFLSGPNADGVDGGGGSESQGDTKGRTGRSYRGGGAGGSGTNAGAQAGGSSHWGGGGGGGGTQSGGAGAGGASVYGGNGGAGSTINTAATAGTQPGGGGGGSGSGGNSGAGAAGRLIIIIW